MACATVCDDGDEGVSGFFSALGEPFGEAFGDLGDFLISIAGTGSFGISTCSGFSTEKVLFKPMSGLMSGLLPNVKLFDASGFDDNLNDGNFSEFKKMLFELSVAAATGLGASANCFGRMLLSRALSGKGS